MEYIITPFWFFLDYFAGVIFMGALLPARKDAKRIHLIAIIIFMCIVSVLCQNTLVKQLLNIIALIIVSFLMFSGSMPKHFLCVLLILVFSGVLDTSVGYGVCALLKISYTEYIWRKLLYVVVTSLSKLIAILLAFLFRYVRRKSETNILWDKWLLLSLIFPAVSLSNVVMIFANLKTESDLSVATFVYIIVLACANIAILYLIQIMEKQSMEEQQYALMKQQMAIQTESITSLEKSYREQRKSTHEFIHHMQTLSGLLENQSEKEASDYISYILNTHSNRIFAINSHHPILDAVFNQKYQQANEKEIEMRFSVNDLSIINIGTNELVVLFSNLLDNAIEACEQCEKKREIICNVVASDAMFISIKNTSKPVEIKNGYIKTTKKPKEEHGFGLNSVTHILNSFKAEYAFEYKDGWFQFVAEIPLE